MSSQLIEIFLFIDPLGKACNNARKIITNFRKERTEKIKIRVIPMVNFNKVYRHTRKQSINNPASIVEQNNHFSNNTYQACLAFHASAMQGKNMAFNFLTVLQEQVVEEGFSFSEDLVYSIVKNIGLDVDMFKDDFESELTKKIYKKNLKIAAEMQVKTTPSLVIFKDNNADEAYRINKDIEHEMLHSICGLDKTNKPAKPANEQVGNESVRNILEFKVSKH